MIHRSYDGILSPDGRVALDDFPLPEDPVRVLVTILQPESHDLSTDVGDYLERLTDYEAQLAEGKIVWQ